MAERGEHRLDNGLLPRSDVHTLFDREYLAVDSRHRLLVNPKNASPPHPRKREPDPPSPDQAARLLNLTWAEDEEFGLYLWTAFTTGARRGEVSALRENRFDFTRQQVRLARNYLVKQGQRIEKAPKDGEGRVLSLDLLTC